MINDRGRQTEWLELLQEAVEKKGQAAVARALDYSVPTLSLVLNNKYGASTAAIEARVLAIYGGGVHVAIPEGYKQDARDRLVPVSMINEVDLLRDQVVMDLVDLARELAGQIKAFKERALGEIQAMVQLAAEKYEVRIGGDKGNVTLVSYNGEYKIQRAVADHLVFDERLQAAKALIDECLKEWTEGGRDEIKVLVNDAFNVDKEGKINTKRVLGLRRLEITDPKWLRAMQAIADSLTIASSMVYIRIYKRDATGMYRQLPLDLSAA